MPLMRDMYCAIPIRPSTDGLIHWGSYKYYTRAKPERGNNDVPTAKGSHGNYKLYIAMATVVANNGH